jgi:hypothetical protein
MNLSRRRRPKLRAEEFTGKLGSNRQRRHLSQPAVTRIASSYFGVLAVTSTSMSIPGQASAVTTRKVPAG